jgi:hypothetical protein
MTTATTVAIVTIVMRVVMTMMVMRVIMVMAMVMSRVEIKDAHLAHGASANVRAGTTAKAREEDGRG